MALNPTEIIRHLYADVGEPGFSERERLTRMQRNCMEYRDKNTCYLVLEVGSTPRISWRHLTERHFGIKELSYKQYMALVHPAWMQLYLGFGLTAYQIAHDRPEYLRNSEVTFTQYLPLLCGETYYWYEQIAMPATTDGAGQLTAHLNYYRKLPAAYDEFEPIFPRLTVRGRADEYLDRTFALSGMRMLPLFLAEFLTRRQIQFIERYRALEAVREGGEPDNDTAITATGVGSLENLRQIKKRIGTRLKNHFEGFRADTAHEFAVFLNKFFPA